MKNKAQTKLESDDRAVAIYHVVYQLERFEESAQALFNLVQQAQQQQPGKQRMLHLDIQGHKNDDGGFDSDMFELQIEFLMGFLSRYVSEIHTPLVKAKNPHPQDNDIPPALVIQNNGVSIM